MKKAICFWLALCLSLALMGCGGPAAQPGETTQPEQPPVTDTQPQETEQTPPATQQPLPEEATGEAETFPTEENEIDFSDFE